MKNKYNMTVEDNVFLAKRNVIDSIWKEANIEGIAVTFPDTREVFEGRTVPGMSVNDTIAINNLKHGWQFILDTLDVPVDLAYVRQVSGIVGAGIVKDADQLRQSDVSIGGTTWKPDFPDYDAAKAMIAKNAEREPGQERALSMFMELCRAQLFYDGNKRTAQLVANRLLIGDGAGVLSIPVQAKREFEYLLVDYYETGNMEAMFSFLDRVAIDGIAEPARKQGAPEHMADLETERRQSVSATCDRDLDHQETTGNRQEIPER